MDSVYPVPDNYPGEIVGYPVPWIVSPGDSVEIKVSCTEPQYTYRTVRVLQGTQCTNGPARQVEEVAAIPRGTCPGRFQLAHPGSHAIVPDIGIRPTDRGIRFTFYVQPWLTECGHIQSLASTLDPSSKSGIAIALDEYGAITLLVGQGSQIQQIKSPLSPAKRRWSKVCLTACHDSLNVHLAALADTLEPAESPSAFEATLDAPILLESTQLLLAACLTAELVDGVQRVLPSCHFNGRLDTVTIDAIGAQQRTLACYDFSVGISSDYITDASGNNRTGTLINAPSRAVKGHAWDGSETDWTKDSRGYGAIHFHEDDLDDANWDTDFSITIPNHTRSGVYVVEIESTTATLSDQVVFFVRPTSQNRPPVALILSTFTYLAYANEHQFDMDSPSRAEVPGGIESLEFYEDENFAKQNRRRDLGQSCYDVHKDLSAVMFSSAKRPLLNCRPDYINWTGHRPRELSAELLLQGFLERLNVPYDIVTDHDLHTDGVRALTGYSTIITGCHPEYHTLNSYAAYEDFARRGGNIMYLGGNGFYWSIATDEANPHRIEVRRGGQGVRTCYQEPGERVHAFDGRVGGLWRDRGKAANYLVGIGCCGEGAGPGVPYCLNPRARELHPKLVSWVFARLDHSAPELIFGRSALGGFGGGASADEIDRVDIRYGSPANTIILASSTGHPDTFGLFPEDVGFPMVSTLGTQTNLVRSDMVYYETCGGGAVFSVGSISWYCALGWNAYENDVAIITENVIRRFGSVHTS